MPRRRVTHHDLCYVASRATGAVGRPLPPAQPRPKFRFTLSHTVEELERELDRVPSHVDRGIENYIERCRQRIPDFVSANFSIRQTWELQRPTVWFDLACAPVNSAWALPFLAIQKVADTAERVGYPKLARWARCLPPGIKTGYQRQIERRICSDLLEWDRERSPTGLPDGLRKELDETSSLRRRLDLLELERPDHAPSRTLTRQLHQFSSGRAILSDLFGTLLTLAMSWVILGSMSLSLSDVAHGLAKKGAHERAASRFFLGKKMGSAFYNVFPPAVHESTIWMALVFVVVVLTVGGMAGTILSDPIRKCLGFHRNRLEALLDELERDLIVLSHKSVR